MSTDLTVFTSPTGNELRTVQLDGEPWFVAVDVCLTLGITDSRKSVGRLDEDERNTVPVIDALGREQQTHVVNEPGLYSLILRSRKPEAKAFKRWVTHEVLPSIRKTGRYEAPEVATPSLPAAPDLDMQARVIATLSGVIASDYLEAKARIVLARALGEQPEIDPAKRPLTVSDYFAERGMTEDQARPYVSRFGRAVKGLFVAKHDREPETTDRYVNGSVRRVKAYTEADRGLFDAAWSQMFPPAIAA